MVLLIDNFDSFTYNLYDYIAQLGIECQVFRNNEISIEAIQNLKDLKAIVLSPGPGTPKNAGILMDVIDTFHNKIPILGICLGHQGIGEYFGSKLCKADKPMHGKTSTISFKKHYIFNEISTEFEVMRYHSLILNEIPKDLNIIAKTKDNVIMAIAHQKFPLVGIQFHPESILTENGLQIMKNFFDYHL